MKDNEQSDKKLNRTLISMLAFITVAVFLCLYFSITIYGNGTFSPISEFDVDSVFTRSDFNDLSYKNNFLFDSNNSNVQSFRNIINNNPSINDTNYFGDMVVSDFNGYIWTNDGFYLCDTKSFLAVQTTSQRNLVYFHIPESILSYLQSDSNNYVYRGYITSDIVYVNTQIQQIRFRDLIQIDNDYYVKVGYYEQILVNTNCAIYPMPDVNNISTLSGLEQINPNFHGSMSEEEKALEHMNFSNASAYLDVNTSYQGNVVLSMDLDEFQFDNADSYNIVSSSTLTYNAKNRQNSTDLWIYTKSSYSGSYQLSLSNFTSSGSVGIYRWDMTEFLSTMRGSANLYYPDENTLMQSGSNSAPLFVQMLPQENIKTVNASVSLLGQSGQVTLPICIDSSTFVISDFTIHSTFTIYKGSIECGTFELYYDGKNGSQRSNSAFRTNKDIMGDVSNHNYDGGYSQGDTNYVNPNDYLPINNRNGNSSGSNFPSSNAYGGSSSATGGSPSVNVNTGAVTVNTSQDPKAVVDYIKGELLPSDTQNGFVEKLEDVTQNQPLITLMSQTFSFVPETVWSDLSVFVSICFGILVGAFVLRIILDLL